MDDTISGSSFSYSFTKLTPEEQIEFDRRKEEFRERDRLEELAAQPYHHALKDSDLKSPIKVSYLIICTGCGKKVRHTIWLSIETARDGSSDIWSPAIPDGWLQVVPNFMDGVHYGFFHSHECYEQFLRRHGLDDQADEFRDGVWIA